MRVEGEIRIKDDTKILNLSGTPQNNLTQIVDNMKSQSNNNTFGWIQFHAIQLAPHLKTIKIALEPSDIFSGSDISINLQVIGEQQKLTMNENRRDIVYEQYNQNTRTDWHKV
ncbi:hypothetical protein HHI36_013264 [Cryptolaemus montrouzieri]|uniref:Uncharacterized protein n=1 Tax=Cryptolaemus montrouzieri TaxID=559131 RepID=A0ABD2NGM6_9CUCU